MKNPKFTLSVLLVFVLASCSNEVKELEVPSGSVKTKTLDVFGQFVEVEDGILSFRDKEALDYILSNLEQAENDFAASSKGLNLEQSDISFEEQGFRSIYDVFDEAMSEASHYYDKWKDYAAFKSKYPSLYFPEVGEDYSAYLPVSNKTLAKLANEDGFIKINNELVDCKDISSYATLDSLGLTPPNRMLKSSEVFYHEQGDNKVWINYSTIVGGIKFEVCFRDKGALGIWFNRKASTSLTCACCDIIMVTVPTSADNIGNRVRKNYDDQFFSHDYEYRFTEFTSGGSEGYWVNLTFGPWGSTVYSFALSK